MKIILTGGTGFIGYSLQKTLALQGHKVIVLTRRPPKNPEPSARFVLWDPMKGGAWQPERAAIQPPMNEQPRAAGAWQNSLNGADACVNLAGEPIAAKRWTKAQKLKIIESRCDATHALAQAIQKLDKKPKMLINASAVGFYGLADGHGPYADETLTEEAPAGTDFLAQTCKAWETHAIRMEDFGLRVVRLRIGIVLEKNGGALQKMIPPFKFFIGGPLGDGRQWMSWIHREDVVGLILWALENSKVSGPLNATAPNPVTMLEFASTLGKVMGRPSLAAVPGFVLKTLLGEMSGLLLKGRRIIPEKALRLGYQFKHPSLEPALRAILHN